MKCEGCGTELPEGATRCASCGRAVTLGQKTAQGAGAVVEGTGVVAGKVARGLIGGAKGFAHGVKKGYSSSSEEKKE